MKQQFTTMTNEAAATNHHNHHHHLPSAQLHVNNASQRQQQQIIGETIHHNHQQQQHHQQHQPHQPHHQHHQQQQPQPQQHLQQPHQHQHHHQQQQHQQTMNQHQHQQPVTGQQPGGGGSSNNRHLSGGGNGQLAHQVPASSLKKELPANGKKTKGRVRIKMEFIHNKLRRYTTFSKRKTGIMKKAFELATLTGTQVMLLVASETGHVYTFATRKLQPMIISDAGKALIQTCLNSPDSDTLLMSATSGSSSSASVNNNTTASTNGIGSTSQPSPSSSSPGSSTPGSNSSPASGGGGSQQPTTSSNQNQHSSQQAASSVGGANQGNAAGNSPTTTGGNGGGGQAQQHPSHQHQQTAPVYANGAQTQSTSTSLAPNSSNSPVAANGQSSATSQLCPSIQSQHNMMLAANSAPLPPPSSSSSATSLSSSSSASNNSTTTPTATAPITNGTTNANTSTSLTSTTDQRMSATGFEETELSYSINDDLNDRAFNNCLPISIGTIAGNVSGTTSSASVITTSPQAFEETLQSQEAESVVDTCLNGTSQQQQNRRQQQVNGNHHQHQQQATVKNVSNRGTNRSSVNNSFNNDNNSNTANKTTTLIEQPTSIQLLPSPMQVQLPQFNYNPLYTGVQHFANTTNSQVSGHTAPGDDKNIDGLNSSHHHQQHQHHHHMNGSEHGLLAGDDEDVLNDIYHYSDSTEESSCNKQQHCHSVQAFSQQQRDSSDIDGNSSYCTAGNQHQSANMVGYSIHQPTSNSNSSRKQEVMSYNNNNNNNNSQRVNISRITLNGSGNSGLFRSQQQQFQHQSLGNQTIYMDGASSQAGVTTSICNNLQRQRNKKIDQQDHASGRKRLNNQGLISAFNTQSHNNQANFIQQQHQFTTTCGGGGNSNGSQMDLSEECNGLFVEYQTNRNSLGGLEELHSLNVTNCDSETLEEHINMLNNEDCFETGDDLQDFGIGSTNDHFFNMLFTNSDQSMNGGNQSSNLHANHHQSLGTNQIETTTSGAVNFNQISVTPFMEHNSLTINTNGASQVNPNGLETKLTEIQQQQQHTVTQSIQTNKKTAKNKNNKSGNNNKSINNGNQATGGEQRSKITSCKKPAAKNIKNDHKDTNDQHEYIESVQQQHKITTTNTNKRLLPKKTGQMASKSTTDVKKSNCSAVTTWITSPSSTSNTSNSSAMSPSSQFSEYEIPYKRRQQLENLRKKLKMDVLLPAGCTGSSSEQHCKTNINNLKDTNPILGSYQVPKVLTTASQNGASNAIFVTSQNPSQRQNGCAYVIARPIDTHGFETNGTIYLRTHNGLVPISSDRRSGLPIVNLGSATELQEYPSSSTATGAPMNSSLIINCVNGNSGGDGDGGQYPGANMTTQGPTNVIFQAAPSDDQQQQSSTVPANLQQSHVEPPTQILISDESGDSLKVDKKGAVLNDSISSQSLFNGTIIQNNSEHMDQAASSGNNNQQQQQKATTGGLSTNETPSINRVSYDDTHRPTVIIGTNQYPAAVSGGGGAMSQQQQQSFRESMQLDIESS